MKFKKKYVVDNEKEADIVLQLLPTDSIQQSDIYCLLKGTNKWMSVKDIVLCLKGEEKDPRATIKVSRMLKSLWKTKFILRRINKERTWGNEYQFKIRRQEK